MDPNDVDLSPEEEEKCRQVFAVFDRDGAGHIDARKMRIVLESMGHHGVSDRDLQRMLEKADLENYGHITLGQFKRLISRKKNNPKLLNEEETLDAFIAMGGEESGEGTIDTETLVKVLKQDFEMTVDIEQMIKNLDKDMSGKIDYDEFRYLLSSCM